MCEISDCAILSGRWSFCGVAVWKKMVTGRRFVNPTMAAALSFLCTMLVVKICVAEDPTFYFDWDISYITVAPLGVKQRVYLFASSLCLLLIFLPVHFLLLSLCCPFCLHFPILPSMALSAGFEDFVVQICDPGALNSQTVYFCYRQELNFFHFVFVQTTTLSGSASLDVDAICFLLVPT